MSNHDPLYPPTEAAAYMGDVVTPATLQWWRVVGRGPAYVKVGRRVAYHKSALDDFLEKGVVQPEPEIA
jgi:hypothetical protein